MKFGAKGRLEVICGSMFSGKSGELIRRIQRSELANQKVVVFKHSIDDRMAKDYIYAHNGQKYKAIALEKPEEMEYFINDEIDVIAIDEAQFFSTSLLKIISHIINKGKLVIVAGLDLDFRGYPFGIMPTLMAVADSVTKLNAICVTCGREAAYSQRLVNGMPARVNGPLILIGAQDCYQARCRDCFIAEEPLWKMIS